MNDLTPNALSPQGEHAPGPEPLSPNAMTVLDAFLNGCIYNSTNNNVAFQADRNGLAAALRALADQVVPTKPEPVTYPGDNKEEFIARYNVWLNMRLTRNKILAIATELEN